ncbi:DNA-3-methyladenine glycosylase family protein [Kytococcus sp. Marseille-QA3725]
MTSAARVHEGTRLWRAPWALDLVDTLSPLRRGAGDPTVLRLGPDELVLGVTTPDGPGTLQLRGAAGPLAARAWGRPGVVEWLLDGVPELVGALDRPDRLHPRHPVLERAHARWSPRVRVPRTRRVWDALLPAVLEQKVTGQEAFAGYRALVRAAGTRAPGPAGERGLLAPPDPAAVLRVPSWTWSRCGIDSARSDALQRAARVATRLEGLADRARPDDREALDAAHRALRTVPGIGPWTAAEVAQRALGDPDAVSWGDYHVAGRVTAVLTGEAGDDRHLARVLAPYAGQRYRVQMLLGRWSADPAGRRGPRLAPRTHLPTARGGHTPSGPRSPA